MPSDLYVVRGSHPDPQTTMVPKRLYSGSGAPTGNGVEGDLYLDEDAGDIYEFASGAWEFRITAGGGGGGIGKILRSTSDPSANPNVGANGALHYNTSSGAVFLWGGSAWEQILG